MNDFILIYNIGMFSHQMHRIMVNRYGPDYHQSGMLAIQCGSINGLVDAPTGMVIRSSYIIGPSVSAYADFHKMLYAPNRSAETICQEINAGKLPLCRMEGIRNAVRDSLMASQGRVDPLEITKTLTMLPPYKSGIDAWMAHEVPTLDLQSIQCRIDEYIMGTPKEESLLPIFEEAVHEKRREQATKRHIIEGDKYAACCRLAQQYMEDNPVDIEMFSEEDLHAYLATFLLKVKPTTGDSNV